MVIDPEVVRQRVLARLHGSDPDWDEDDLPPLPGERESGYRAEGERHRSPSDVGTAGGATPRGSASARRGAQRVAFGRRIPEPGRTGRENRPPRTSQPRASPSAESSHDESVQMEMGGNVEIERRAARPATSSSQRGQSLSLLKREHAARPSPAYRNVSSRAPLQETSGDDGDGRNTNASSNERRPRFTNSHTAVYNRLLAESAARRVRARPRNNDTEQPHAQDTHHTWRVNFEDGVGSPGPPPHPRLGNRPHHSSHNTTEDEGGGYWGATEPEEGGNTDAYDVPDHDGFNAMDGLGRLGVSGARRSRRRGGNLAAASNGREDVEDDDADDADDAAAMSTGEEDEPSDDDDGIVDSAGSSMDGGDIGTLPRDVDVVNTLRGDNLELRDKLREATEMLSRVSEERAAATQQRTLMQRQLKEAVATRERLREREAASEREKKDAADAARAAETRAKASEKKLEKLANAKKAALEAESRTVRAESRISALEMELAAMRERVERAEEERDEAKAESKAMAVWRIETDEAARSSDHASLSAAVDEAELILAPFAEEDGDEDIDTILSPQAKSQRAGHRDETNTRSKHPLVAVAARAAGNMGRREARLGDLLSALTGEMAASKRAEKEIGTLQKKVAELEMTAVAATRALEAERSGGGAFGASGGDDPPTPSAREVASMAVGLASSAKSRIRDAEDELITTRKTIESMRCEIQALESKLERSERLRAGLRLAADASEAMTEHVAELEASNGTLRDECMATSRVALHLHRRWRKARMDRWVEGRSRGLSSFGAEMKDAKSAVFFCFKFWRELSKGDTPMKGGVGGDKGGSSRRGSIEAGRRSSVEEDGGFTFAPNVSNAAMPPAAHQPGSTPFKDLNPFANKSD